MKKNCNYCRALDHRGICNLGYKTATSKTIHSVPVEYKPLEECPKPKTYDEYLAQSRRR